MSSLQNFFSFNNNTYSLEGVLNLGSPIEPILTSWQICLHEFMDYVNKIQHKMKFASEVYRITVK